ncbi:hypothetical protein BKA82DRAFT_162480, partial [Pisolithus tinctorius]
DLRGGKILQVFMVSHHVSRSGRAFQVMLPVAEGLENCQQLLIMSVIVELRSSECVGVKGNWAEFTIGAGNREDTCNGIVRCIGLNCDWGIRHPMSQDWSRGESGLKAEESGVALFGEAPRSALPSEVGERNNYSEGQKCCNVCEFRPIMNGLDLISRHGQTGWGEDIAKVLNRVFVELALFWLSKEAMLAEAAEDLFYMLVVQLLIVGVDEDVIKVNNNADIEHVSEDAVNKPLESCWHISKTEGHNQPFIGTIASVKGSFPFITSTDSD